MADTYEDALAEVDSYEKAMREMDDPDVPTKPQYSKGRYEPQLGRKPQGKLPEKAPPSLGEALGLAAEHGATLGAAPTLEAMGTSSNALTPLYRKAKGIPEAPTDDRPFAEKEAASRAKNAAAEDAYPVLYPLMDAAASLPTAVALAPVAATKKAIAGGGALIGGLSGFNEADHTDPASMAGHTGAGAGLGALFGLGAHGLGVASEWAGQKASDLGRGVASLFGREIAPNVPRAADFLGVPQGSKPNAEVQSLIDNQSQIPVEKFPPAVFNKASPSAPDALAQTAKYPRTQVAQSAGEDAARQTLGRLEEIPAAFAPDTFQALFDIHNGIMPREAKSMGITLPGMQTLENIFGPALEEVINANAKNLDRINGNPQAKAELIRLIASGRPGMPDSDKSAILARIGALLGQSTSEAGIAGGNALAGALQ